MGLIKRTLVHGTGVRFLRSKVAIPEGPFVSVRQSRLNGTALTANSSNGSLPVEFRECLNLVLGRAYKFNDLASTNNVGAETDAYLVARLEDTP